MIWIAVLTCVCVAGNFAASYIEQISTMQALSLIHICIIAELILWKAGYGNAKGLTVSYIINQVLAGLGSTIYPYVIAAKSMADMAVTDGRQDNINAASDMLQAWGWPCLLYTSRCV